MHVVICSRYKLLVVQALKSRQAVARGTSRFGEPRYRVRRRRVRFHLTFLRSQNESPKNRYRFFKSAGAKSVQIHASRHAAAHGDSHAPGFVGRAPRVRKNRAAAGCRARERSDSEDERDRERGARRPSARVRYHKDAMHYGLRTAPPTLRGRAQGASRREA